MSEVTLLADQLEGVLEGGKGHWFAPGVEVLKGLDAAHAAWRGPGIANSSWDLVNHIRWEIEDVYAVFTGAPKPAPGNGRWQNWPLGGDPADETGWAAAVEQLFSANRALVEHIRTLTDGDLEAPPPGRKAPRRQTLTLLAGHTSYHLGQIVLLRRMQEDWTDWNPFYQNRCGKGEFSWKAQAQSCGPSLSTLAAPTF